MADVREHENTAAANDKGAIPDFPKEGWDSDEVNNWSREYMAAIRREYERFPWLQLVQAAHTVTRVSDDSFQVATGDYTWLFTAGLRVRVSQGGSGWVEREVASSAFTTVTTVTLKSVAPAPTTAIPNPSDRAEVFNGSSHQAAHRELGVTTGQVPLIEDLGDGATLDQGEGNGYDADTVDGKHYADIEDAIFSATSGDNLLVNSDFGIWQGLGPSPAAQNDNANLADQWNLLAETNACAALIRTTTTTEIPPAEAFGLKGTQAIVNEKWGVYQVLEAFSSKPLRGKNVSLRFDVKRPVGATITGIRFAILEWSGAADAPTDPIGTWPSAGADFTPAASWTIRSSGSLTLDGTWQEAKIDAATIDAAAENVAVILWTDDDTLPLTDVLLVSGASLTRSDRASPHTPELPSDALLRCQRYFWKTFQLDTAPAEGVHFNTGAIPVQSDGNLYAAILGHFPVRLRAVPTWTYYTPNVVASGDWLKAANGVAYGGPSAPNVDESYFSIRDAGMQDTNKFFFIHAAADARFF